MPRGLRRPQVRLQSRSWPPDCDGGRRGVAERRMDGPASAATQAERRTLSCHDPSLPPDIPRRFSAPAFTLFEPTS
jgi:hypothetical protein